MLLGHVHTLKCLVLWLFLPFHFHWGYQRVMIYSHIMQESSSKKPSVPSLLVIALLMLKVRKMADLHVKRRLNIFEHNILEDRCLSEVQI
jgi:hypothetical protein